MTWPTEPDRDEPRQRRERAGQIGWGLLFALAAILLFIRLMNGGGC